MPQVRLSETFRLMEITTRLLTIDRRHQVLRVRLLPKRYVVGNGALLYVPADSWLLQHKHLACLRIGDVASFVNKCLSAFEP